MIRKVFCTMLRGSPTPEPSFRPSDTFHRLEKNTLWVCPTLWPACLSPNIGILCKYSGNLSGVLRTLSAQAQSRDVIPAHTYSFGAFFDDPFMIYFLCFWLFVWPCVCEILEWEVGEWGTVPLEEKLYKTCSGKSQA